MSDILSLFFLGLLYGATTCSITCLPYLSPYLLATGKGFKDGILSSFTFVLGKLFTYALLGSLAGYLGYMFITENSSNVRFIQGVTLITAGLSLPFINSGGCYKKTQIMSRAASLFTLGVSTSLIPCLPLLTVLLLAAREGSVTWGLIYGFIYGLGIVISPTIIMGGILSLISKTIKAEARSFIPYFQGISILIMVIMGIRIII